VWQRHDLTSMKHHLKTLEAKVARDGVLFTEAQIAALEKAKADRKPTASSGNGPNAGIYASGYNQADGPEGVEQEAIDPLLLVSGRNL